MRKGFASVLLATLVILIIFIGVVAYYFGRKSANLSDKKAADLPSITSIETATWPTYTDTILNFSIKYPRGWETYPVDTDPGARTYRLQDTDESRMLNSSRGAERVFQKAGPMEVVPPIRLGILKSTPQYNLAYYEEQFNSNKEVENEISKIKVDGIESYRYHMRQKGTLIRSFVMLQKGEYLYSISTTKPEYEEILNSMMSSLKFTN